MAIAASAIWRVRTGGNNLNGGVYDPAITGGTDYTQQDAAQASWTGLSTSSANSTTLLDSGNGFTAAMVGNAINLASGANAVAGFYFVTAYQSAGAVTLDRAPASGGALSGGTGRLGGAHADFWTWTSSGNATGAKPVPGNTVYVRGSGSDTATTPDYTRSSYYTCVSGDTTNGALNWAGENGRPVIGIGGLLFFNNDYLRFTNFRFVITSSGTGGYSIVHGVTNTMSNVVFDQGGYDACLFNNVAGLTALNCEFTNTGNGTAGSTPVVTTGGYASLFINCLFHGLRGTALQLSGGGDRALNCIFANNKGNALVFTGGAQNSMRYSVTGCTFDANAGNGIMIPSGDILASLVCCNNLITNHTGAGKAGIVASGVQATNDRIAGYVGYNFFFNNTTHSTGLSVGAGSVVGTDPGYVSQSTEDYRIGPALKALGLAGFVSRTAGKASPTSYVDPGAVQRQEPAGGGGGIGPTLTVVG